MKDHLETIIGAIVGFYLGALAGNPKMEWWGHFGESLGPVVGLIGVLLIIRQIKASETSLRDAQTAEVEGRVTDTLRLVTEWLESEGSRSQRQQIFRDAFIDPEFSSPGHWAAFRKRPEVNHPNIQRVVEDVVAQFDRVGSYLKSVPRKAKEAVLDIYGDSIARCWLVVGPHLIAMRVGRGEQYGQHFVTLAEDAISQLEHRGQSEIRLHPFGQPSRSLIAPIALAREPLEQARRIPSVAQDGAPQPKLLDKQGPPPRQPSLVPDQRVVQPAADPPIKLASTDRDAEDAVGPPDANARTMPPEDTGQPPKSKTGV